MKVDLHVHCRERSPCARSSIVEQIRAAVDAGLDAIAFTDHGQLHPAQEMARLNEEFAPLRILDGIELTIASEDIIVLGVTDPALATESWTWPRLHDFVREHGGFLAVAHPFRYRSEIAVDIQGFPPDAIEVYSSNTPRAVAGQILEVARRMRIPVLCDSDAHDSTQLGRYYNLLDEAPHGDLEIFALLRQGAFTAVMREEDGGIKEIAQRAIMDMNRDLSGRPRSVMAERQHGQDA
ncbi:MAG: PHP domain-containing protein [Nitrospirae bacterium]|nr:PHP domain-containing protein [Nitrospirota bacterium]